MTDLRTAAQQALEAMDREIDTRRCKASTLRAMIALRAALAQQAEPVAQQAEPLTVERLRDALVASRIIQPAAVEDPDEYDDGVTLYRIEALHRRIT